MIKKQFLTVQDGRAFAIEMLSQIAEFAEEPEDFEPLCLKAMYRVEGSAQNNLVERYIVSLLREGSPESIVGFSAILTDYIYVSIDGYTKQPDSYKELTERDITGIPGPWPSHDEDVEAARTDPDFQRLMSNVLPST